MVESTVVKHVAHLARIEVTDDQVQHLAIQLSHILDYIDTLTEVDVSGVQPLRGLHQKKDIFRADQVRVADYKEEILNNAPSREGDYFKIPKVIG